MLPAVVLSSHTTGLGVTRALGKKGVPVTIFYYQKNDMGYVSGYVKEAIHAPHPEHAEDEFIDLLMRYGAHRGRSLLIPADDATLMTVSANKSLLSRYYIVACTEAEITEKIVDKKHTYALAKKAGIPMPDTIYPRTFQELDTHASDFQFPCLVKPCVSHQYYSNFNTKMVTVNNMDELCSEYLKAERSGLEVVVQELIPGDDTHGTNYNSYFWEGRPVVEYTAEKVRMSPPGFGVPSVVLSKHIPQIIEPGRRILKALGYYGYSCTEFKKDPRDGVYKLLEVNGRHNRSTLLAVKSGVNFPWIEYRHLVSGELVEEKIQKENLYWIDEFRDLFHSWRYLKREGCSLRDFLQPYLGSHLFAVFDAKDVKPFLKRISDILKMIPGT